MSKQHLVLIETKENPLIHLSSHDVMPALFHPHLSEEKGGKKAFLFKER